MQAQENLSKLVSYVLRHGAVENGIKITVDGYVETVELIDFCKKNKFPNTIYEDIVNIVCEDQKQRYSFIKNTSLIRANQGHSMNCVKIEFEKKVPPVVLYHGTTKRNLTAIKKIGLSAMKRHHVHLTDDIETAKSVGLRHGSQILIVIDTKQMLADGLEFLVSDNGVWLVDRVDPKYFKDFINGNN